MISEVVNSEPWHIEPIAARIRQSDLNEVWAVGLVLARPALELSLRTSEVKRTWMVDGKPEAMAGITRQGDNGLVWLLATDVAEVYPHQFLRASRRELNAVRDNYDRIHNFVDARNVKSIRWIKWLGFDVTPAMPFGRLGKPFHYFSWQRREVRAA